MKHKIIIRLNIHGVLHSNLDRVLKERYQVPEDVIYVINACLSEHILFNEDPIYKGDLIISKDSIRMYDTVKLHDEHRRARKDSEVFFHIFVPRKWEEVQAKCSLLGIPYNADDYTQKGNEHFNVLVPVTPEYSMPDIKFGIAVQDHKVIGVDIE